MLECLNTVEAEPIQVMVLIDSGCTQSCIDCKYAMACGFLQKPLDKPVRVLNADGTPNRAGPVETFMQVCIMTQGHTKNLPLAVASLGTGNKVYLGHEWLKLHNPTINWRTGELSFQDCPQTCKQSAPMDDPWDEQGVEEGNHIFAFNLVSYQEECFEIKIQATQQDKKHKGPSLTSEEVK